MLHRAPPTLNVIPSPTSPTSRYLRSLSVLARFCGALDGPHPWRHFGSVRTPRDCRNHSPVGVSEASRPSRASPSVWFPEAAVTPTTRSS